MKVAAARPAHAFLIACAAMIIALFAAAPAAHAIQDAVPPAEELVHGEAVEAAAEETRGSLVMMILTTLAVPVSLGLIYFRRWHKLDGKKLRDRVIEPVVAIGLLLMLLAAGALGAMLAVRLLTDIEGDLSTLPVEAQVKGSVIALSGMYVGQAAVLFVAWLMLKPRTKSHIPRGHRQSVSVVGAVCAGVGALLLFWPLVVSAGLAAGTLQEWLFAKPMRTIAHETLAMIVSAPADGWRFALLALVIFGASTFEEIFYRGILHRMLRAMAFKPWHAIIITSVVFAVMHANVADSQAIVALFVLSLGFGWIYERTGRLAAPIAMHAAFNGANALLALLA